MKYLRSFFRNLEMIEVAIAYAQANDPDVALHYMAGN